MAGSIIIAPGKGVALNSQGFDLIVSAIRKKLIVSAPDVIEDIFDPLDSGGMTFISVSASTPSEFMHFYEAAKSAFSEWNQSSQGAFPEWQELIEKLAADERHKNGS